jgi:hypothetical protein
MWFGFFILLHYFTFSILHFTFFREDIDQEQKTKNPSRKNPVRAFCCGTVTKN